MTDVGETGGAVSSGGAVEAVSSGGAGVAASSGGAVDAVSSGGAGEAARSAFWAAMEGNAGVAGDSCNRGMLVGALLGAVFGARNLPAELVTGLFRSAEAQAGVAAFVDRVVRPQFGSGDAMPPEPGSFGHPCPLPPARYGDCTPVAYPRDFAAKTAAIAADAAAAAVVSPTRLAWIRGVGPVVLPVGGGAAAFATPIPRRTDTHPEAAAIARWSALLSPFRVQGSTSSTGPRVAEEGDAAADRAAALAALASGGNGATPAAPLCASAPSPPISSALALSAPLPVRLLTAADMDADHPVRLALRDGGGVGTGVLYHRTPADVAQRR